MDESFEKLQLIRLQVITKLAERSLLDKDQSQLNGLKTKPFLSMQLNATELKISSNSFGVINFFQSCVPRGNHLKIYSAPMMSNM